MCQRLQGRSTRQIRRPLQIRPAAPSCTRSSTTIFCMSLRGAKRRGNPFSLRQRKAKRNYSRRIRRSCGFALSIANLLSFPAGTRIATPVCALVRNDMQKEGRVRGGKNVARNDMQKIAALLRVQEGAAGANPQPPTNSP